MADTWAWIALIGLGAFHGINPAMGWLFAVALGLHRGQRRAVQLALVPLALGHALAIGATLAVAALLGRALDPGIVGAVAGALLMAWGLYHFVRGHHQRVRVGMQAGFAGLMLWSFLMATAHGAGLMLLPVFFTWGAGAHGHAGLFSVVTLPLALGAVAVHSLAMLGVTGVTAVAVYEWIGLAVLRRGWINMDWLWSAALISMGAMLFAVF